MARPLIPSRVAVGFLAAFMVPGVVLGITAEPLKSFPDSLLVGVIFLPSALLFGPTMLYLYRRKGWEGWWSFALGGGVIGVGSLLLFLLITPGGGLGGGGLVLSAGLGAIGALALRAVLYFGVHPE